MKIRLQVMAAVFGLMLGLVGVAQGGLEPVNPVSDAQEGAALDIKSVGITNLGSDFRLDMSLYGNILTPQNLSSYLTILIGSNSLSEIDFIASVNGSISKAYRKQIILSSLFNSNGDLISTPLLNYSFDTSTNTSLCSMTVSALELESLGVTVPYYFMGITADSGDNILDRTSVGKYSNNISSTPIPAAAWLFASGLLGLIGLKRRKSVLA